MNVEVARAAARRIHAGYVCRSGEALIEHVERVAAAVPEDVRALAYLHDVLERSDGVIEELCELGVDDMELVVLSLLTRRPDETYKTYIMRIARAEGHPGCIARVVKLADLDDHLRQRRVPRSPNYAWARERILASQLTHAEIPQARIERERTVATDPCGGKYVPADSQARSPALGFGHPLCGDLGVW